MASSTDGSSTFTCLEAALERGVLLDVFAVLVERGGADALQLAAAEGGLDDVGGVHRALGGAGADDGVQLVDEEDDVLGAADLVHHRLDALLELAAVLGAGDHQGEVEGDDLLVAQDLRHVAVGDFLGEPSTMAVLPTPASPMRTDCSWCGGRGSG
jgi:hypothetical protein